MLFTIKNLKTHEDMSEETTCFSADVYVHGVKAFHASNHGHGGCNEYHAYGARGDDTLLDKAYAWAKEQPLIVCDDMKDPHDPTKPFSYQPDLDHFIDAAIDKLRNEKLVTRHFKRDLKKTIVAVTDGDKQKVITYSCPITDPRIRPQIAKKYPNGIIINDLPYDEGFALYQKLVFVE